MQRRIFSITLLSSLLMSSTTLIADPARHQLIRNGQFETWQDGMPTHWTSEAVTPNRKRSEAGISVQLSPGKRESETVSSLAQPLPELQPETTYRLDFWTQRDKLRRGGVRFTIEGCTGKGLTFAGDGGYFAHLAGYRYTRYFTTGEHVDTNSAAIRLTGAYGILDGVSLSPVTRGFSGIEYSEPDETGTIQATFSLCNQTPVAHSYEMLCEVTDYFGSPLATHTDTVVLQPNEDTYVEQRYVVGAGRRYRMHLKAVRNDGVVFEDDRFYEPFAYRTETRQYVNLRTLDWFMRTQGRDHEHPDTDAEWSPVKMPAEGRMGGSLGIAELPYTRLLNNLGPVERPNRMDLNEDYWGFIRANLPVPARPPESRVRLRFRVTHFEPALFIDRKLMGRSEGAVPLSVDITDAVKDKDECGILLRLASAKALYRDSGEGQEFRREVQFMPYQGERAGMRDDPWMEIVPPVRVERVFIDTSVRNRELKLTYELRNDTPVSRVVLLCPEVSGRGEHALSIKPVTVLVHAEQSMRAVLKTAWQDPVLWEIGKPYLYQLTTRLLPASGERTEPQPGTAPLDVHHERFGFREVWTEGRNILLNGIVFRARSMLSSPNPSYSSVPNNFEMRWKQYDVGRRAGVFFHNNHSAQRTLDESDIADEMGILQRPKLSLNMAFSDWRMTFDDSPRFWRLSTEFATTLLEEFYNHPSVGWITIENETFLCGTGDRFPSIFEGYRKIIETLKRMKPGLLVDFDGSDPGGMADIWNLHYPLKYQRWVPLQNEWNPPVFEDGQWMPFQLYPGAGVADGTKPLILGEDLIDYPEMPGSLSFLSDETIYEAWRKDGQWCGNTDALVKGIDKLHRPFVRSYRRANMSVITAWPLIDEPFTKDMAPVAIFIEEPWRNLTSGEDATLHARIHYDLRKPFKGKLTWSTQGPDGKKSNAGSTRLSVVPGETRTVPLRLSTPRITTAEPLTLTLRVTAGETVLADRETRFNALPLPTAIAVTCDLFDPAGETRKAFERQAITCRASDTPRKGQLFVVGRNALSSASFPTKSVLTFVREGGRVLVLAQSGRVPEWLPLRLSTQLGTRSYACFPRSPSHPVLDGVDTRTLRFWRSNGHAVSQCDYWKPRGGNIISILDTGTVGGFLTSALMEVFIGEGSILLCQLQLLDNLGRDPMAAKLLANLLTYADRALFRRPTGALEIVGSGQAEGYLAKVGIARTRTASDVLFASGNISDEGTLRSALDRVEAGATLWLHDLNSSSAEAWAKAGLAGLALTRKPSSRLCKTEQHPILAGLSNADLHWVGMALAPLPGAYETEGVANIIEYATILPGMQPLVDEGALGIYPMGKGRVLVDNLCWSKNLRSIPSKARRIATTLATNLGISVTPQGADQSWPTQPGIHFEPIPLGVAATIPLNDHLVSDTFAGVPFTIASGSTGAVWVGSSVLTERTPDLKQRSEPVPVNRTCRALHFLVTAFDPYEGGRGYGSGELIGGIDITYADDATGRQELRHKVHVLNLFESMGDLREGKLVWEGDTPFAVWLDKLTRWEGNRWIQREHPNRIYLVRWINPEPEKEIQSVRLFGTDKHVLPILIGLTAEMQREAP